jgi:hypothetical protein
MRHHRFHDMLAYIMTPSRRDGAGWGRHAATSSGLAIAKMLGTGVPLNGDGLDLAHGLVAVAAATLSHYKCKFQVQGG